MDKGITVLLIVSALALAAGLVLMSGGPDQPMVWHLPLNEEINENWLNLDAYYFAYNIFRDIFHTYDLDDQFTTEEKYTIVEHLLYNLSEEEPVRLLIENYERNRPLMIVLRLVETVDDQLGIYIYSNYDKSKGRVLTVEEMEELDNEPTEEKIGNLVGNLYKIYDGRIVPVELHYSEELEKEFREQNVLFWIGRMYIFDELAENDQKAEAILKKQLEITNVPIAKFSSTTLLAQYYFANGKEELASQALMDAKKVVLQSSILDNSKFLDVLNSVEECMDVATRLRQFALQQ